MKTSSLDERSSVRADHVEHGPTEQDSAKRPEEGLSRRELIGHVAAVAAIGTLGSLAAVERQARAATGDRKFLFLFATGGWDATPLDPKFGADGVSPLPDTDMDPGTSLARIGHLTWSSGDDRRAMDRFFARWGHEVCLVRGVDVHSAGHESGMKWMMTGTPAGSPADWPTLLATNGTVEYPMPHLVFSGPSYPGSLGAAVTRAGSDALLDLADGTYAGPAGRLALEGSRFEAGLDEPGPTLLDQAMIATEMMRLGLSRSAIVRIPGNWDTHEGLPEAGRPLDRFFADFDALMTHLATTPGHVASRLADEVTVVCASELGRTPKRNAAGGRDHWPYTSCLVAGGGIAGNKVVGETTGGLRPRPVRFGTGRPDLRGDVIGAENLGAALLKLGGLDPDRFRPGVQPLTGILREA